MKLAKIIVLALFIGCILGNIQSANGDIEKQINQRVEQIQKDYEAALKHNEEYLKRYDEPIKRYENEIKQIKIKLEKVKSEFGSLWGEEYKSQLIYAEKHLEDTKTDRIKTKELLLQQAKAHKKSAEKELKEDIERHARGIQFEEFRLREQAEDAARIEAIRKEQAKLEEERKLREEARLKEEAKKLEKEKEEKQNPFRTEIKKHNFEGAFEILKEIDPKNQTNDFFKSVWDGSVDINAKDEEGQTALGFTVSYGNSNLLSFLLDNGADINAKDGYDNTVFFHIGNKNIAEILINWLKKNGLNPAEYLNAKNLNGDTPFINTVARKQNSDLLIYLLENGASIDTRNNNGQTILHFANDNPNQIEFWTKVTQSAQIANILSFIDEYSRTPLYTALEEDEPVKKNAPKFAAALEKQNAPLFGTNNEGQLVFPYATNNPAILVKALTEAMQKKSSMDEESQQRILGEILLPSILFQHQACLPLIMKDAQLLKKTRELFREFEPKRVNDFFEKTINDAKKNIPQVPLHHLAIFIDQDGESHGPRAVSLNLVRILQNKKEPCLIFGKHLLFNADFIRKADKIDLDLENSFHFFIVNNNQSAVLIIPKEYIKSFIPSTIKLSDIAILRWLGFNPQSLTHKKFSKIDLKTKSDISADEFGKQTVESIKNVLTNVKERGRIVQLEGHGWSYLRQRKNPTNAIAVNLSLPYFLDLIRDLEEKGTLFTYVLTCYMGGDNLSALERVMINDFYNTELAKMLNAHQKTKSATPETHNKMFLSVASTADISTSGMVDTNLFFPAVDTFFNLLKSDAAKDMTTNLFAWITRMFRTVGVLRDIVNYPQIRIPGNQTSFYLADIHGDLQIINRVNSMQDRFIIVQEGDRKVVKVNKPKDIVVANKNVLVTYIDHVENKVIIEEKVPVILAMGTNEYFRTFSEIFVDIPEMDFFNFAYNSFYPADFGEEMGHRETYLMKKLTFANEDIFEDIDVPQEIASQKPQTLYNVYLKRGLEEKAAVIFSLGQNPTDDVFEINEDKVVRKLEGEEKELYLARVSAMQAEVGHYFSPLEEKLLKNSALFLQENKQDLAKVFKTALVKSVVLSGRDCDKLLLSYLKLLDTTTDEEILTSLKELLPFLMQNYKEIPSWTLLEKMKFVILSFKELKKETVETFEKIIDKLFEFDEKNKKTLKDLLKKITISK